MSHTAVLLEAHKQQLTQASIAAIAAGQTLQQPMTLFVAGHALQSILDQVQHFKHVVAIHYCDHEELAEVLPEQYALWALPHLQPFSHVLMGSSSWGKATLPRIAAQLNCEQFSDVINWPTPQTVVRHLYAGNIAATYQTTGKQYCFTVRPSSFTTPPLQDMAQVVQATSLPCAQLWTQTTSLHHHNSRSTGPTLATADVILGGGRGLGTPEAFAALQQLALKWGAAVGASRAAVDAGLMANEYQIGQTGQIIAPKLYIAIGISGAIQHLAGILDSQIIVAINKDPDAAIFKVADYKLVMAWQDALPQLEQTLEALGLLNNHRASPSE